MTGDRRPRPNRWPLVAVLLGAALLVVAFVMTAHDRRTASIPAPIGKGTATAMADATPTGAAPSGRGPTKRATGSVRPAVRLAIPHPQRTAPPTRLQIASLDIDAKVAPVGVDDAGDIAIPDDVRSLGWYRYGPAPGSPAGSIVV